MVSTLDYSKPIYCVITGASRGIGRTIATELASKALNKITFLLLARSVNGLNETKNLIENINKNANVINVSIDLSKPDVEQFKNVINSSIVGFNSDDSISGIIFHNAGQVGRLDKIINLSDVSLWQDYFNLNVFSVTSLNSVFISELKRLTDRITVVNITSLFGRKPGKYVGLYGTGKAARDMYFKILASEENDCKILNWSPGMVKTDMALDFLSQVDAIEGTEEKEQVAKNILTPEQTIQKMFSILDKNEFTSGDIVDYYDN